MELPLIFLFLLVAFSALFAQSTVAQSLHSLRSGTESLLAAPFPIIREMLGRE